MAKMNIQIKSWTGSILFEYESENNTIKKTLEKAVSERKILRGADLSDADLRGADLCGADLRGADLTPIKQDFFDVLLRAIPEIEFLKQNIIEGKIDGTTYDGACSCLSGTLERGAKLHNGKNEKIVMKGIMQCRDSGRPIERFFIGLKKGDTPETNQFSKLALDWLQEFESYISILK